MRGTLALRRRLRQLFGIIPAYAGNTHVCAAAIGTLRDHPRVCGEHPGCEAVALALAGSSPRMRGTHFQRARPRRTAGIIPAYAGNTTGHRRSG